MYNTWIIGWLITSISLSSFYWIMSGEYNGFLFVTFFAFLFGLPALIPLAVSYVFLKKKVYSKDHILLVNLAVGVASGFLCGFLPLFLLFGWDSTLFFESWHVYVFPAAAGGLAVWLNQKEMYKDLQSHFNTDRTFASSQNTSPLERG